MSHFQPTDAMAVPGLVKRQILRVTRQHPKYQRHSAAARMLHRIIDGVIENNSFEPDAERRFSRGEPVFSGWVKTGDTMTDHERETLRRETDSFLTAANEMSPLGQR